MKLSQEKRKQAKFPNQNVLNFSIGTIERVDFVCWSLSLRHPLLWPRPLGSKDTRGWVEVPPEREKEGLRHLKLLVELLSHSVGRSRMPSGCLSTDVYLGQGPSVGPGPRWWDYKFWLARKNLQVLQEKPRGFLLSTRSARDTVVYPKPSPTPRNFIRAENHAKEGCIV